MLAKLFSRAAGSWTSARYDRLFTPFAPNGAPAQVLGRLYHQYAGALPDEFVPPQHAHYRALVAPMALAAGSFARLNGPALKRVYAAYTCCFERAETFHFQLAQQREDRAFQETLLETRAAVVRDLLALETAEQARREHYARWRECLDAELDLEGGSMLELIQQMGPDDWHEIAQRWDWDMGVAELNWITSQRACDRATAVYVLCAGRCGEVATRLNAHHAGFVRAVAARLENGFYPNAELGLALPARLRVQFEREIETARATGESPWRIETELVRHPGRAAEPRYTLQDGALRYHYEYWLRAVGRSH